MFLLCLALAPVAAQAGKPVKTQAEDQALSAARSLFEDHQYNLAEARLAAFVATYTNSPQLPYAVLYLARSRLEQSNFDGGIKLLTTAAPQSGELAPEYLFWTARARMDKGQNERAADGFASLIKNFPASPRGLEAACDEAEARSRMGEWPRAVELLQKPDGAFRKLAAADPKNSYVARGMLLLGEAFFAQGKFADGEKVVSRLNPAGLDPEWQWRRQYLLCRLDLAGGRALEALQNSTNVLETATGPRHVAASRFLRGEILEALNKPEEALQAYTNNLAGDLPGDDQRLALLKTVQLTLMRNQLPEAAQFLENYLAQRTNGPTLDLARLSLGELYLKMYFTPTAREKSTDVAAPETNYLAAALTNISAVIQNFPDSPLLAKAHLDLGWCDWAQTNMGAARTNFQIAADQLPASPEQAVARFKLADAEFFERDDAGAVSNYNLLLRQYAAVESVTNGLFDQALYQIVQASLARGDTAAAEAALKKILAWYPNSLFGDRGQLLIGESTRYDYAMARRVFQQLLQRSPKTPLMPEVEYAIARTYEQEGNWPEALRQYESWIRRYGAKSPALLPQVEYSRALAYGKAGMETNALTLFTNFVARNPSNTLAAWAQNWVADYYFNQGENQLAEGNYELLYQAFPNAGDLPYEARLMAGRAALARQDTTEARIYFSDLVTNTATPASLKAQGYFALGDTILQQFQGDPTNTTYLDEAVAAMSKLTNGAPTNALAAQAYGRLGDCYSQWADRQWATNHDSGAYSNAVQMYQAVLSFPATNTDVSTRSEAEVALGRIAEHQNQPMQALAHYCKVLYELDPDNFDPYWVEQAGKAAAEIYDSQQQWDKEVKVYQRVERAVPSLRLVLEKLIINAQSAADKARN